MVYGKFVLAKDGTLFLGSARSFHKDISSYLEKRMVRGAGYFDSCDLQSACIVYGESIGYDISFREEDGVLIEKMIFENNQLIADEANNHGSSFVVVLKVKFDE